MVPSGMGTQVPELAVPLGRFRARRFTALLLVRGEPPSTAPITTTVTASRGESAATAGGASASSESTPAAATAHARNVGALRGDLDVAALEDALVQDQRLGHQTGFRKLHVGVAMNCQSEIKNEDE